MTGRRGAMRMVLRVDKCSGFLASALVFLIACAYGCGVGLDKSTSGTTKVQIVIGSRTASPSPAYSSGVKPRAIPPGVSRVRVTVSAADMTTVSQEVIVNPGDNSVTISLDIPNGTNRLFLVEVLDASLTMLYRGETYADLSGNPADGSPVPVTVLLDHYFSFIASGPWHAVVVKPGGEAWAFGQDNSGQLGNTSSSGPGPVQVMGTGGAGFLGGVTAASGGMSHTAALMSNGAVWTWGLNVNGQLGDNTNLARNVPVQVVGAGGAGFLTGVTAIAAGDSHTVARKSDGTVWAWGYNQFGQLGDGNLTDSSTPVEGFHTEGTTPLTGVVAIAAGGFHTIALKSDGTIWTWGDNKSGQLGDGTTVNSSHHPVLVNNPGGVLFSGIAGGDAHTVALKTDGTVWAWGLNANGQLGNGTLTNSNTPVQVVGAGGAGFLGGVTAVAAGGFHTIALRSDRSVWTWGRNANGQLGNATNNESHVPVQVAGAGGVGALAGVHGIAGGYEHTAALMDDGTVWAWGSNNLGQLGVGPSVTDRNYPGKILGF